MTEALDALIEANDGARAELLNAIDSLPRSLRDRGWFGPAGWSVRDILAHMARWQDGWASALEAIARGERPSIPGYEPNANDPGAADAAYNAESVAQASGLPWERVLSLLHEARARHTAAVRGLAALDPDRYAEGRAARRLADAAAHDREHGALIVEWRVREGSPLR